MSHTPGPWTIEHPNDVTTLIYAYSGNVLLAQVMRGSGAVKPTDAAEHNAVLIAAAPTQHETLLDAEQVLSMLTDEGHDHRPDIDDQTERDLRDLLHRVRAAIAAATEGDPAELSGDAAVPAKNGACQHPQIIPNDVQDVGRCSQCPATFSIRARKR